MTTSELIELLKKEDPSGKLHVRAGKGLPVHCDRKPGYWDGPYYYKDGEKIVISTKGEKVDIFTTDIEEEIWERDGDYSFVKFDFTSYIEESKKEKEKEYIEKFKGISIKVRAFDQRALEEYTFRVLQRIKKGWYIVQPLGTKIGHYNEMYFKKLLVMDTLCQGECGAVLNSGLFKHVKEKDYYYWELNIEGK